MPRVSEFEEFWTRNFGEVLPLGHELRENFEHRWFRIHSLPGSKRYPEEAEEYATMLMRHVTVADAVLGQGAECWLSLLVYEADATTDQQRSTANELNLQKAMSGLSSGLGEHDPLPFQVHARKFVWGGEHFERWLRAVAEENIFGLVWTSVDKGAVYAPYDGGADVVLPTAELRTQLAEQFAPWRSDRSDGL